MLRRFLPLIQSPLPSVWSRFTCRKWFKGPVLWLISPRAAIHGNVSRKRILYFYGGISSLVRKISIRKASLGSILGPFTCKVVKVCSFLDVSAGSTWPHKDRQRWLHYVNTPVTCTWNIPGTAKCERTNSCVLCSSFRFSLYLKLLSTAYLHLVLSWTTKQAVHYKAFCLDLLLP